MSTAQETWLYRHLGGGDVSADMVSDLYDRMVVHPHIWYYWKGRSPEERSSERQRFVELVSSSVGGMAVPQEREARLADAGLGIGLVEW